jgi:putative DNA primase/helicase
MKDGRLVEDLPVLAGAEILDVAIAGGIPFSDDDMALRFAERHAENLRYCAAWGKWFSWTGTHWRPDDTLRAFDLVRLECRETAAARAKGRDAAQLASGKAIFAVERLARADRRLAARVDQWDADPWLLNTPTGVVDLRTGEIGKHGQLHYCTKMTAAGPGDDCPRFLAFLNRVTGGSAELIAYWRRVFGYALTGTTSEHALFFLYGTGANGKSVLLSTIAGILADYHVAAPAETFVASNADRHPTEIARLRGARLVTAVETEEGRRWNESRIKELTGGDVVAARFMRQDFFEYRPVFKLIIAGNHKPSLRSVDEAMRRRFHLIHFAVTIPAAERDLELADRLRAEWPGILAWCIEGALEWRTGGLRPPRAVVDATEAYLQAEDAISAWIEERCDRLPTGWTASGVLFASWTAWATAAGEPVGSIKALSQALEDRGFRRHRTGNAQGFYGLVIRRTDQ